MKGFAIPLLSAIFVILIVSSIQSAAADHTEPSIGIFKDATTTNFTNSKDSKYHIHFQSQILNKQGQLISITETSGGEYIPHEITDNTFNEKLGQKEIVVIDNLTTGTKDNIKHLMNNISFIEADFSEVTTATFLKENQFFFGLKIF